VRVSTVPTLRVLPAVRDAASVVPAVSEAVSVEPAASVTVESYPTVDSILMAEAVEIIAVDCPP
jgi:hypothetical protein